MPADRFIRLFVVASLILGSACSQNRFEKTTALPAEVGPGNEAWENDNVVCSNDSECNSYESCEGGICQMKRCMDDGKTSAAPLGSRHYLALHRDLLVASDSNDAGKIDV